MEMTRILGENCYWFTRVWIKCQFSNVSSFFLFKYQSVLRGLFWQGFESRKMGNELENLKTTANKKILEGTESIDPPQPLIMWKDFIRKREGKERPHPLCGSLILKQTSHTLSWNAQLAACAFAWLLPQTLEAHTSCFLCSRTRYVLHSYRFGRKKSAEDDK